MATTARGRGRTTAATTPKTHSTRSEARRPISRCTPIHRATVSSSITCCSRQRRRNHSRRSRVTTGDFGGSSVYSTMLAAAPAAPSTPASRLAPTAALAIRAAIRLARGNEVCFVGTVDEDGVVQTARVVARGDIERVLALPTFAERGDMLIHNHPSGVLEPSDADLAVAARLHDDGVGFAIIDNAATELYVVVEVPHRREYTRVEPEAISHDLGPDGVIASSRP